MSTIGKDHFPGPLCAIQRRAMVEIGCLSDDDILNFKLFYNFEYFSRKCVGV